MAHEEDYSEIASQSEHRDFRIFGPPGTGKTEYLTRQISRAVDRYGPDSVLVTSFTRTAAHEIASRADVRRDQVGTLHSHCFRALGSPPIAELHVEGWNEGHPELPISATGKKDGAPEALDGVIAEEQFGRLEGDIRLQELSRLRGAMVPRESWLSGAIGEFDKLWTAYKQAHGLLDFTDLIEQANHDCYFAPGDPKVIVSDESQDLTPLQLQLINKWSKHTEFTLIAGDDDQMLYGWCGCRAEALIPPPDFPQAHVITLAQSWRVPRRIHQVAQRWVERIVERQPKNYHPRDEEGEVFRAHQCGTTLEIVERELARPNPENPWPRVMILASCGYMLDGIVTQLREAGIPFYNPYRPKNGMWNPLSKRSGSASSRLLALFKPHHGQAPQEPWTIADLRVITEWMETKGHLLRGAKKRLAEGVDTDLVTPEILITIFQGDVLDRLVDLLEEGAPRDLAIWWRDRLLVGRRKTALFPVEIVERRSVRALAARPDVVVGTIHSVKGGQADAVVVMPDLSFRAAQNWQSKDTSHRDSIRRIFYVALTRARDRLYLPGTEGNAKIDWAQ